jgi:Fe-S cluster assembly ATP-binding protein
MAKKAAKKDTKSKTKSKTPLLEIRDLHASIGETPIIKGISLTINRGEVHAIMGPNGSGKSTLSYVLAGRGGYEMTGGDVLLDGVSIRDMEADERARAGMFLAFQYPVELPGVGGMSFLRGALDARRIERGEDEIDNLEFVKLIRAKAAGLGIKDDILKRAVNVGFSGGEKKRYEILQMALLEPSLAILDETDSGLDVDALKIVSEGVNTFSGDDNGMLVITHYQRLLDHIIPDHVHILVDGNILKSGDKSLALKVEKTGYSSFTKAA